MPPSRRRLDRLALLVLVPVLTFPLGLLLPAAWTNSPTIDEPIHIRRGASTLVHGQGASYLQMPPLAPLIAGAAVLALTDAEVAPDLPPAGFLAECRDFLYDNTADARAILRAARTASVLLFAAMLASIYLGNRRRLGIAGAALAALACGCLPLLLALASIVSSDLSAAAFFLFALLTLRAAVERDSLRLALLGGLLGGAAAMCKLPAVLILPCAAGLWLAHAIERGQRPRLGVAVTRAVACVAGFVLAVAAVELYATRNLDHATLLRVAEDYLVNGRSDASIRPGQGAWALPYVTAAAGRSVALGHLALGVAIALSHSSHGNLLGYLNGVAGSGGNPWSFPEALLLKTPLAFAALAALGLLALWHQRRLVDLAFSLLPLLLGLALAMPGGFNLGLRYLAFTFPPLAYLAGAALGGASGRAARAGVAILAFLLAAQALRTAPHFFPFGNLVAGGSSGLHRFLSDSNLDWGQEVDRFAAHAREEGLDPTVLLWTAADLDYHMPGTTVYIGGPAPPGTYAVSTMLMDVCTSVLEQMASGGSSAPPTFQALCRQVAPLVVELKRRGRRLSTFGHVIEVWVLDAREARAQK